MRKLLLLRPEPGLSASAQRAREMGLEVIACSLFEIVPIEWEAPNPADYDALLLTSANAIRHGGPVMMSMKSLPVHAVGQATAAAARESGFQVETVGDCDVADLLTNLPPSLRLLHLAGEDHREIEDAGIDPLIVYRSAVITDPQLPPLEGLIIAIHSPRAGKRLAELTTHRSQTAIAAISAAAAEACDGGWERIETAVEPNDKSLLALAAMLCHTSPPR